MSDTTVPLEDLSGLCDECRKRIDEINKLRKQSDYLESLARECAELSAKASAKDGAK